MFRYFSRRACTSLVVSSLGQLSQSQLDLVHHPLHCHPRVGVRPSGRFGYDGVHQTKLREIASGESQRRRRPGALDRVTPHDGRARLGRDDRVPRVLQHQHPVGNGQRQGPARAAFAYDHGHSRYLEVGESLDAPCDRSCLAAFLGVFARVGTRSVHQRHDGKAELLGQSRQAHGLAVALRPRHTEAALLPFFQRVPLLVSDEHDPLLAESG